MVQLVMATLPAVLSKRLSAHTSTFRNCQGVNHVDASSFSWGGVRSSAEHLAHHTLRIHTGRVNSYLGILGVNECY